VLAASVGAVVMLLLPTVQAQPAAADHSPGTTGQNPVTTTRGAIRCCKLGNSGITDESAAIKCCRLGRKAMMGGTEKEAAMSCCKLGTKGGANGPGS
jgi:hypothetical protein